MICPVPRSDDPSNVNYSRPTSLEPTNSKRLETVPVHQVHSFLEVDGLLNECQYRSRPPRSTVDLLAFFSQFRLATFDNFEETVSLDVCRAFE